MRRPRIVVLIGTWVCVIAAVVVITSMLAPTGAQAETAGGPRVQFLSTLNPNTILQLRTPPPILRALPVLRTPLPLLATPAPIFRPPRIDQFPSWAFRYMVPTPEPHPTEVECGDTLQGLSWVRGSVPDPNDGGCTLTITGTPGNTDSFNISPLTEGLQLYVELNEADGTEIFSGDVSRSSLQPR